MKNHTTLRIAGVLSVVLLYAIFSYNQPATSIKSLGFVLLAIVALISPEVIDKLPFGPSK